MTVQSTVESIVSGVVGGVIAGNGGAASGPTLLVSDTFTDSDKAINLHTPDTDIVGGGWSILTGDHAIISNKLGQATSLSESSIETNEAEVSLSGIAVYSSTTGETGLIFRLSDISNYWMFHLSNVSDELSIYDRVATSFTQRATTSVTVTSGIDYLIEGTANGQSLSCTLDGANQITYGSASFNQTETKCGARNSNNANGRLDDFTVSAL